MLDKNLRKEILLHILIIAGFLALAFIYSFPVIEGNILIQGDIVQHNGMANEIKAYRLLTNSEALWTNSMFGGMTAFFISVVYKSNLVIQFMELTIRNLPISVTLILILCLGMFTLLRALGLNKWLAAIGAIAFAFSSNYLISLEAGHNTKVATMGYSTGALGGIILAYKGKLKGGLLLTMLFMAFMFVPNHLQIIYYFLIITIFLAVYQFIIHAKQSAFGKFFKTSGLLIVVGLIALSTNTPKLWSQYEHGQQTMRGGASDLTYKENKGGLEKDYAFRWSLMPQEVLTTYVPYFMGGSNNEELSENSKLAETINNFNIPANQKRQILENAPTYFGKQPFTAGPNYFGATVIFLFILAFFLIKSPMRYWLIPAIILSFFLSWGRHFAGFNYLLFDYLPFYNKFRTPSMALHIAGVLIPVFGFLGLSKLLGNKGNTQRSKKGEKLLDGEGSANNSNASTQIKYAFFVALGILGLLALYGLVRDFSPAVDSRNLAGSFWMDQQPIYQALIADRERLYFLDILRSAIFVTLLGGLLWLDAKGRIKNRNLVLAGIAIIMLVDIWSVSKRYFNNADFRNPSAAEQRVAPNRADMQILQSEFEVRPKTAEIFNELRSKHSGRLSQNELSMIRFDALMLSSHYRVFNISTNTFNDAITSYFHKSVGGYHPAKLQRYQDMIDFHISRRHMPVLNMLNTRYFIVPGQDQQPNAQRNPGALGTAWFVNDVHQVTGVNDEIRMLHKAYRVEDLTGSNGTHVHQQTFETDTLGSFEKLLLSTSSNWQNNSYEVNLESLQFQQGQSILVGTSDTCDIVVKPNDPGAGNVEPIHARITLVYTFSPSQDAFYAKKHAPYFDGLSDISPQPGDEINMTSYEPNHNVYESNTSGERIAVFSDIYYDQGWNAYIDGEKVDHANVNYILRAIKIPSGKHKIEFKFEPRTYYTGSKISLAGSILLILLVGGLIWSMMRERKKEIEKA